MENEWKWQYAVSLSVFSLVPDLLFDCSRLLEYAKIRTVLQSMENNTVITVISYYTKGLNNSKTKQKPIPTIHNKSIKSRVFNLTEGS